MTSPVSAIEDLRAQVGEAYDRGHVSLSRLAEWCGTLDSAARQAEALQRENAELREALRPFADLAGRYDGMPATKYFGDTDFETRYSGETKAAVTVSSLRLARALLGGSENAE